MYNPETVESLLAYTARHQRPASAYAGFRSPSRARVSSLLRKVRKSA